jgi:hypothetical protein
LSRVGFIVGGVAVVAIAFTVTLFALNYWWAPPEQTPSSTSSSLSPAAFSSPTTQATSVGTLPALGTPGWVWLGVLGLNAQQDPIGKAAVSGQPVLRLIAVPSDGGHYLAAQVVGLNKDQTYRVAAWVKPVGGANFALGAGDLIRPDASKYHGTAFFDLVNQKVLPGSQTASGIAAGLDGFQQVWIDLPTASGRFAIDFYVLKGADAAFKGDGKMGVILGGFSAAPPS